MLELESRWVSYWRDRDRMPDGGGTESALRQVGKTVLGEPVPEQMLDVIAGSIIDGLSLTTSDRVWDLGCGNGIVTNRIARRVEHVEAVDISDQLLADARLHHARANITYRRGDLRTPASLTGDGGTAAYAYEVLQHLEPDDLDALLRWLRQTGGRSAVFFAGGVPDLCRIRNFYDTAARWQRYEELRAAGTEQIGRWWTGHDMERAAHKAGFVADIVPQPAAMYTAHYRFDVRFEARR